MSVTFNPELFRGENYDLVPDTNCSNANAVLVLEALGITGDFSDICCGSLPVLDFRGRVLLALAIAPTDEGTIPVTYRQGDSVNGVGATVYDLGRSAGYLQDKLVKLLELTDWAIANGRNEMAWG